MSVLGGELDPAAVGSPDHQRNLDLAAGEIADLRGVLDDLIDRQEREVHGHHLDDGPHAHHGHADGRSRESTLADRGVDHPFGAVLLEEVDGDEVSAAVDADVLTDEDDALVAVQLVDAVSGAHLWAENYERTFSPEAVFELQDELVPRIVSTVADMHGVLPRSMSEAVRSRNPGELSPYEAVLRSFGYFDRLTGEDLAAACSGLESAVRKAPTSGDAWAMLALLCVQDYAQGFNLHADALEKGLGAARRAVEVAPSNHLSHSALAQALFFLKEFQSFRNAAERAVALNPMDGNALAFLGELLSYSGDCERGAALAARAKQLNPNHPGFYWYANFYNAYRQQDHSGALAAALNLNLPGHMGAHMVLAATYGQLGEREAAEKAVRDLLKLRPDFASIARGLLGQWWIPEYVEQLIDGWRKAGLEVAPANAAESRP